MISYITTSTSIKVYLDGKQVGSIMATVNKTFRYWPKGGDPGDEFETLTACKKSLE